MRVFINPGHAPNGQPDPGAINPHTGARECDIALSAGNMLAGYLQQAGCQTEVFQCDSLADVCATSDEFNADVFVSLHCNACASHDARGTETWYKTYNGARLAQCIQSQIINSINTTDRGIKQTDSLWVLNGTNAVAVLVELGFIDNDDDLNMMNDNLDAIVRGIARGITDYESM